MTYQDFLASKRLVHQSHGVEVDPSEVHATLFDFQNDCVRFGLRKGQAAIWLDVGLGKTLIELEFARLVGGRSLIVAPLAVAHQTVKMAHDLLGMPDVRYVRHPDEMGLMGVYATNYEMVSHFKGRHLDGLVLDESSILASIDGKTRKTLIESFTHIPYRLSCSATPMPNAIDELAGQCEFLGVMTRAEMLATWFVHDDEGWRLRGHAREPFYRWIASWAIAMSNPADLGYDGSAFVLPPLDIREHVVETAYKRPGWFIGAKLHGIGDRQKVRRNTIDERVEAAAKLAHETDEQFIIWAGLNPEATACAKAIRGAVEVKGGDPLDVKIERLMGFAEGKYRVLVSKPKICGFGMNFQNAHRTIFLGLGDSWQSYYQAIARQHRFGQVHPVQVDIIVSSHETAIVENIQRKQREAKALTMGIIDAAKEYGRMELRQSHGAVETYSTKDYEGEAWKVLQGDSAERMKEIPSNSVDLSVYSPPFLSLYQYSATERDMGNSRTIEEFFEHFGFVVDELLRMTKPGRLTCCHVAQVASTLQRDGFIGIKDFRGRTVDCFNDHGWDHHGEAVIEKNPQIQAIRTHAKGLLFVQVHKDATWSRPGLNDMILIFRKPGDNSVPVIPDIDNETWKAWANGIWRGISETDTLNTSEAKDHDDDRHICPLQLGTIERCIRLWSNPGELIFSPFGGIGSEAYQAIKLGRKALICELKPRYAEVAARNCRRAETETTIQPTLDL